MKPVRDMTIAEAKQALDQLNRDADDGKTLPPLRYRLDLFYKATGTTAKDYESRESDYEW